VGSGHEWPFDRNGDEELALGVSGAWCGYQVWFSWCDERRALQICCAYDMRVPEARRNAVHSLLCLVNEQMFVGHFDLCSSSGTPMFRHTVLIREGADVVPADIDEVLHIALGEAERYYPAFQYVVWAGKPAGEALAAAMIETAGRA
ncbi:MAG: hypothetical protein FJX47_09175, partial [Alphaproteobacteria bacterium]|nr:hypothetical protein [Alphaproteobacteria bacterium]